MFDATKVVLGQRIFVGGAFASPVFVADLISSAPPGRLRHGGAGQRCGYRQLQARSRCRTPGFSGRYERVPSRSNSSLSEHARRHPESEHGAGPVFSQGNSEALTLTGLGTASATASVGVVARGLVLKDSVSGDPVLWAHRVREVEELQ